MIVVRAPLRITFAGSGTDNASFYKRYPGRVLSTAIDKFVYVVVNRTPLIEKVSARYSMSETVNHPSELQHTRIKAALTDAGILKNIEIASFASLPAKTGLGSSSSFSVALIKALSAYQGNKIDKQTAAESAARLEIELLGERIGKQDQYAAAFGGFNEFQFNADHSVGIKPVLIDYKIRLALEDHMLVFFTGIPGFDDPENNADKNSADIVPEIEARLMRADFKGMASMVRNDGVKNPTIDDIVASGMGAGAWGGKTLDADGGGCIMLIVPPEKKSAIRAAVAKAAGAAGLADFQEIPVHLVQSGVEVLHNSDYGGVSFS